MHWNRRLQRETNRLHSIADAQQSAFYLRQLSAHQLPNPQSSPEYLAQRDLAIDSLVSTITTAFMAWERSGRDTQERNNALGKLLEAAADVGIMLYQQPSAYEFSWAATGEHKRKAVPGNRDGKDEKWKKLPALLKVTDEKGALLENSVMKVPAVDADA